MFSDSVTKTTRTALLAAAVAALVPAGASALSFSVAAGEFSAQNGTANNADVFAPNYGTALPFGATWNAAPNTVNPPPGGLTNFYKSPWVDTGLEDSNSYYSVQGTNASGQSGANPAVLSFTSAQSSFKFLWGSIDSYNYITFSDGSTDHTVSGSDVAGVIGSPPCGDPANFECVALVEFTDDLTIFSSGFDTISFESKGANAFEFATIPLPAAAWLLLGVSGGLIAAKRRQARRAA